MLSSTAIYEALSTYIRPQTNPMAIKMLNNENEIPPEAKRPLKDFGNPIGLCQALALTRREGLTIVLDKDSQSCPIALVGLGFAKPEALLSGEYKLAPVNQSTEARKKAAESLPLLEHNKYKYILISPLNSANFQPDVITFYGNSAQVMRLIQAAAFTTGESATSKATGAGSCFVQIAAPVLSGGCQYSIPGNGERRLALTADHEVAFSMPQNRFDDVVSGLKLSHEGGQRYPISSSALKLEPKFSPPAYAELLKVLRESS
jgi:uncharacterized protein (DUF169 family)